MPWSLWLARLCLDPMTGRFVLWPRDGGWHDQDEEELEAVRTAWYVWRLFDPDKERRAERTADDADFLAWLEEDFDTWEERWALGYINWMDEGT